MTPALTLREVADDDLPIFYGQQLDPVANHMAAFTVKDPTDRDRFDAHWRKIRSDERIIIRTIVYEGSVAGHIASFERMGEPEVTYWIGKEYWGRGIATGALARFLDVVRTRPLFARAATDNLASIRVLEKCGFTLTGHDRGFADGRGEETEEVIMRLGES